jgi:hypothetical protein
MRSNGGLGRPQLVATLYHLQRRVEGLRVDHGADVARQFAYEEGDMRLLQGRRLQGGQIVPQHRGPAGVTAAHRIIQPLVALLDGSNVRLNWNIESDMNVN